MTHDDQIAELLGAYALDAVDDDERIEVQRHLAGCARCRAEVHEHRETAALLAHRGGDAPEGVWQRVADSLEEPPPRLRLAPVDGAPTKPAPARLPTSIKLAAAAAAAVIAVLGAQVYQQHDRIEDLRVAYQDPLSPQFEAALDDPASDLFTLASADGALELRGAITDDGLGYLQASALPPLTEDRTYQLWGAAGDQLISLGVIGRDPEIVSFRADPYESFAITEETAPGVVVSENLPIAAGSAA